jgi:protease-4
MKTYPHLFSKLFCSALMLRPIERNAFEQHLLQHMGLTGAPGPMIIGGQAIGHPEPKAMDEREATYRRGRVFEKFGDVAVIHIDGVIDKRVSMFDLDCYGGVDLADVDAALSRVAGDASISKVVLDINSPGGSVVGVHETFTRIQELAKTKEVHAYVNCLCCSAGYYIASAADVIAAAPSAIVGSIGVYIAMLDASKWAEIEGLSMHMIKAGKWKDTGSPWRPLTDEEKAKLQASVDSMHAQFRAAVRTNRDVEDDAMEGQWMPAEEAEKLGLVDSLTIETLDEYVSRLL